MKAMQSVATLLSPLRQIGTVFARPKILFYTLPWLMFLVVMGTVSQKNLGLYEASEKYFNSIILWLGPIPTPGGLTTIGIIFMALSIKFVFYSPWNRKKAGTIITHLGILLLLLGGIITSAVTQEGFMIIPEGRNINQISDYYKKIVHVKKDNDIIASFDFDDLSKNQNIGTEDITIRILEKCENCGARAPSGIYPNLQDMAANMELYPTASEKQKEANFSGLVLDISNVDTQSGTYIVMEDIEKNPTLKIKNSTIEVSLTRRSTQLPFSITLNDFRKIDYPGTQKAKEYEADITLHDGDLSWPSTISMNKPLRYKGYTLYQSSFEQRPNVEVTVLNVVKNEGRAFPYIATLVIFIGLLVHLILHLQTRWRKQNAQ